MYGIDHVGPINPKSQSGKKYLIVAVDYFTKFVIIRAVPDTSTEVAKKFLMEEIVLRLGVPDRIISDRGSCFTSSMWAKTLEDLGIEYSVATTERPQTNGLVERANGTIVDGFSALARDDFPQWDSFVPFVSFSLNSSVQSSSQATHFELVYSALPRIPALSRFPWLNQDGEEGSSSHDPVLARSQARLKIVQAQAKMKKGTTKIIVKIVFLMWEI